jgi:hypothetical protein
LFLARKVVPKVLFSSVEDLASDNGVDGEGDEDDPEEANDGREDCVTLFEWNANQPGA